MIIPTEVQEWVEIHWEALDSIGAAVLGSVQEWESVLLKGLE